MSKQEATVTKPTTEPTVEPEGAKPTADETLGAPGLAALKSEREAKAAAEKRATAAEVRLKEIEDRDKSEAEKQAEALAQAKAELAEVTVAKTRAEVAAAKGVPAALLSGSTQAELEAAADALIAFKGEKEPQRLHIPSEGKEPKGGGKSPASDFAEFMEKQLGS